MAMEIVPADGGGGRNAQTPHGRLPCHIFLPVVAAARVIGKGGANIRAIREESGAAVHILQKELPQEMQRREDRVAVITGELDAMREAIRGVLERVFDRSGLPDAPNRSSDRAHIVEMLVPLKTGSHLIGQGGERIKSLIEETQCDINVAKDAMSGLADQKRVRITGDTVDDTVGAVWRLHEVMVELVESGVLKPEHFELREAYSQNTGDSSMGQLPRAAQNAGKETPVRLLVSGAEAAWIVGKRGNKITRLRDLAKVAVNDAEAPPYEASKRFVEITAAPLEQRVRVVQMIVDDLALRHEASDELNLLVPTESFGSVMGHRGETIRGIMQTTGASMQQHKAERMDDGTDYRFRLIKIKGDERQQVEVVRQVHEVIESRGRPVENRGRENGIAMPRDNDFGFNMGLTSGVGSGGGRSLGSAVASQGPVMRSSATSGPALQLQSRALQSSPPPGGAGGRFASDGAAGLFKSAFVDSHAAGKLTLQLAMPSEEVARLLASESSGIAWRAGVQLASGRGAGGIPILEVLGTAVGNSVACYLVQDRLFMMH